MALTITIDPGEKNSKKRQRIIQEMAKVIRNCDECSLKIVRTKYGVVGKENANMLAFTAITRDTLKTEVKVDAEPI